MWALISMKTNFIHRTYVNQGRGRAVSSGGILGPTRVLLMMLMISKGTFANKTIQSHAFFDPNLTIQHLLDHIKPFLGWKG